MNRHLLAGFDVAFAASALAGILPAAVLAAKEGKPLTVALAAGTGLFTAAALVNSAVIVWGTT